MSPTFSLTNLTNHFELVFMHSNNRSIKSTYSHIIHQHPHNHDRSGVFFVLLWDFYLLVCSKIIRTTVFLLESKKSSDYFY